VPVIGVARLLHQVYYHNLKSIYQLIHPYTYKFLSSELLNCKITDTLNIMTHQESNTNLEDLLKP